MSDWVKITERRPAAGVPVLVRAHDGTISAAKLGAVGGDDPDWAQWEGAGFGGWEWDWEWRVHNMPWGGVTHWAPMPEGPRDV